MSTQRKTKTCSRCKRRKKVNQFRVRGVLKDGSPRYASWCSPCQTAYSSEKRRTDQRYRDVNNAANRRARARLREDVDALRSEPCTDCGKRHKPWQMQFDHVRGKKLGDVGTLVSAGRRHQVMEEIKKCELVCANCHADRTYQRREEKKKHGVVV